MNRRATHTTLKQLAVATQGRRLTGIQLRELLVSRHWDQGLEGLALLRKSPGPG